MKRKFNWFSDLVKLIALVLNLSLGINVGFIFDSWLSPVFNGDLQWAGFVVALASGVLIAAGSFGLFIKTEIAYKSIMRIKSNAERNIRLLSLVLLVLFFVLIGVFGLLYRLEFLNSRGIGFLVVIGIALECTQPLFGLVLTPIENIPLDLLEEDLSENFDRSVVEESFKKAQQMPLNRRLQAFNGDFNGALQTTIKEEDQRKIRRSEDKSRRHLSGSRTKELPAPRPTIEEEYTVNPR